MEELTGQKQGANLKSDVAAKEAFCERLRSEGYTDVAICAFPTDVVAVKDSQIWRYEVKFTRAQKQYFGAATLTEWVAAADDPAHFPFVVAYRRDNKWHFDVYTPDEFMAFSSVPPYKIFFSAPLDGSSRAASSRSSKRIRLTKARLRLLTEQFEQLRKLERLENAPPLSTGIESPRCLQ